MQTLFRIHLETVDSTNNWAKAHAHELPEEGLSVISADHQSGGRGRFCNRGWFSPKGLNIYATFCFFMEPDRQDMGHAAQVLALSGVALLEEQNAFSLIKWPNDLMLNKQKIGGILCESLFVKNKRCIIAGIGININMQPKELEQIGRPATSLFAEQGILKDPRQLLHRLEKLFSSNLDLFLKNGFSPFFQQLKEYSYFKTGDPITFHDNQQLIEGSFEELLADGSVRLLVGRNRSKIFYSGEFCCTSTASFLLPR